jgi:predicted lipoprotein with Yx(FWY)xxD motif
MKKTYIIGTTLVVLVLLISACSPVAVPTTMPSTYAPQAVIPVTGATVPASIMVGKNDTLGSFLVDDKNMTLYLFTKDTPNTSNCYEKCATAWPPLLTKGAPVVGTGVDGSKIGTTTRKDGSEQVTYNGWPLYYYIKDAKAGDVVGQNVGEVWFVINPAGEMVKPAAALPAGPSIMIGKNDALGSFLVDEKNMTLYLYTKDTPNTSNCYDKCATAWPPLLTTGAAVAKDGVDASKLGTTKRTDGSMQVTYNGWPLYYFAKDSKPGDVTGQNVGEVWFVITPAGEMVKPAAALPAAGTTVMVGKNDTLGSFLVDAKNMTLYLYTKDTPNTSNCYDKCATAWPPLLTTGSPIPGTGVDDSKLGTTKRTDGSMQVTYNGWPLYYYIKDSKPGDVTGQNVGSVWFVITPDGKYGGGNY